MNSDYLKVIEIQLKQTEMIWNELKKLQRI